MSKKNALEELVQWVNLYCANRGETAEQLPEASVLEIREFLAEDGFSQEEIGEAVTEYFSQIES